MRLAPLEERVRPLLEVGAEEERQVEERRRVECLLGGQVGEQAERSPTEPDRPRAAADEAGRVVVEALLERVDDRDRSG